VALFADRATAPRRWTAPFVPLLGLAALWSAALVDASQQLFGLGTPIAVLLGALALGAALSGLSLGHWYLVSPGLAVQPLVRLTFLCLGAIIAQLVLLPVLVFASGSPADAVRSLISDYNVFFGVRIVFGLIVPLGATVMTWRTARIRSLDSATGLLYIVAALVLAGEIAARTLFFLTGVAT
jgi:DMSO reductase anchor subunit